MHLETLHSASLSVENELTLEADVRDLGPDAAVRATVDVDGEWLVEKRQAPLEFLNGGGRLALGLHDRQLAELDAGAGHGVAAEGAGVCLQTERLHAPDQVFDRVAGHVEDQDLLVRRGSQAV